MRRGALAVIRTFGLLLLCGAGGRLVEAGVLSFDDTLEKMFPELVEEMQPEYRKATVRLLLAHTAGLPGVPRKVEDRKPTTDRKQAMANRYQYVRNALADPPLARPGTKNIYSGSCVIVVSYAERRLGKTYEELMQQYVFRKLHMTTAGKFMTATLPEELDGPWPHVEKDGHFVAIPPRAGEGISRSPAGGVCLSIADLGRWASAHLQGENGHSNLLRAETFRELHRLMTPVHATMSFGRQPVGWARGEVLWHNGAHVGCSATLHIVPQENYAIGTASNCQALGRAHAEVRELLVRRVKELGP